MTFSIPLRNTWIKFKSIDLFGLIITTKKWVAESFSASISDGFIEINAPKSISTKVSVEQEGGAKEVRKVGKLPEVSRPKDCRNAEEDGQNVCAGKLTKVDSSIPRKTSLASSIPIDESSKAKPLIALPNCYNNKCINWCEKGCNLFHTPTKKLCKSRIFCFDIVI